MCFKEPLHIAFPALFEAHAPTWAAAETATDVLFFLDMTLSCVTGYYSGTHLVQLQPAVLFHYCRTWAFVDVVSTIPFHKLITGPSGRLPPQSSSPPPPQSSSPLPPQSSSPLPPRSYIAIPALLANALLSAQPSLLPHSHPRPLAIPLRLPYASHFSAAALPPPPLPPPLPPHCLPPTWPAVNEDVLRLAKFIRLLKLFKLLRLLRSSQALSKWVSQSHFAYFAHPALIRIFNLCCGLVLSWHVIGCIWWFLRTMNAAPAADGVHGGVHGGGDGTSARPPVINFIPLPSGDADGGGDDDERWDGLSYIEAYYWAVSVTTGIGVPVLPSSHAEAVFDAFVTFLGILLQAYMLGSAASALHTMDAMKAGQQHKLDAVKGYLRTKRVPVFLRERIVDYFEYLYTRVQASAYAPPLPPTLHARPGKRIDPTSPYPSTPTHPPALAVASLCALLTGSSPVHACTPPLPPPPSPLSQPPPPLPSSPPPREVYSRSTRTRCSSSCRTRCRCSWR